MAYAGPVGSQDFFMDSSHSEDLAAQGNFSGHGHVAWYRPARQERRDRRRDGDACRGAVLWDRPFRKVNVQVFLVEDTCGNVELVGSGAHVG